nr:immunoglobulin heavy chain junction region [Macaca mulatta]
CARSYYGATGDYW